MAMIDYDIARVYVDSCVHYRQEMIAGNSLSADKYLEVANAISNAYPDAVEIATNETWGVAREMLKDEITKILDGIDHTQCDTPTGWWETSTGAEFGANRLALILAIIDRTVR